MGESLAVPLKPLGAFDPLTDAVLGLVGPWASAAVAVGTLFASLRLFDRILSGVDAETVRDRFFVRLRRKWLSFGIGLLVTGITTSVAFSLGVIVPLYNRGYVERREVVPYVLGANVGTLVDTLVVAVVLDAPVGTAVVGALVVLSVLGSHGRSLPSRILLGSVAQTVIRRAPVPVTVVR